MPGDKQTGNASAIAWNDWSLCDCPVKHGKEPLGCGYHSLAEKLFSWI